MDYTYIAKTYTTYNNINIFNYEPSMNPLNMKCEEIEECQAKCYDTIKKYVGKTEITRYFKIDTRGSILWQDGDVVWNSATPIEYGINRKIVFADDEIQLDNGRMLYTIAENVDETINNWLAWKPEDSLDEQVENIVTDLGIDYYWHITNYELNQIKIYIKEKLSK